MARLGSHKRPAVVRVQSTQKPEEIVGLAQQRGWKVIVGVEPNEMEDLSRGNIGSQTAPDAQDQRQRLVPLPQRQEVQEVLRCRHSKSGGNEESLADLRWRLYRQSWAPLRLGLGVDYVPPGAQASLFNDVKPAGEDDDDDEEALQKLG